MKLILNVANQHITVTVLLEYIDLFPTCMKIMLGSYYSIDIMFNALPSLKVSCNIGRKSTNHRDKIIPLLNVCVFSKACNTDFRLFIVLGDEFNIQYFVLHLGRV